MTRSAEWNIKTCPTCAERDGVDEAPWKLFSSSSVPEREVICIEDIFFVSSLQEVSENEREEDGTTQG